MVTSLEFMTAEVKRPFFIDKSVDSLQIFRFFKQTRLDLYDFLTNVIKGHYFNMAKMAGVVILGKNFSAATRLTRDFL